MASKVNNSSKKKEKASSKVTQVKSTPAPGNQQDAEESPLDEGKSTSYLSKDFTAEKMEQDFFALLKKASEPHKSWKSRYDRMTESERNRLVVRTQIPESVAIIESQLLAEEPVDIASLQDALAELTVAVETRDEAQIEKWIEEGNGGGSTTTSSLNLNKADETLLPLETVAALVGENGLSEQNVANLINNKQKKQQKNINKKKAKNDVLVQILTLLTNHVSNINNTEDDDDDDDDLSTLSSNSDSDDDSDKFTKKKTSSSSSKQMVEWDGKTELQLYTIQVRSVLRNH